jgi:site-specific DNA recombinase
MASATPHGRRRAIGYLRVSTRGQAEKGLGLAAQRDRVLTYAKAHDLELLDVVEEAASGAIQGDELFSHEHRPVLSDLLSRAGRGKRSDGTNAEYEVLLVPAFDRLSRDHLGLLFLKRLVRSYGVQPVSAIEGENIGNGGPFAELFDFIIAWVAGIERDRILDRVKAGKTKAREAGKRTDGYAPYGFTLTAGRLEPVEEQAVTVRRIFEAAKAGDTPGRIAKALNADGIPGPTGRTWNRQTVRNIIGNVAYAGEQHGRKKAHPAIVTRQLWNRANEQIRSRARPRT